MADVDRARLIAAIATRLQIRLDEDDPAFVIVELNRLILDQAVRDVLGSVRDTRGAITTPPCPDYRWVEAIASMVTERVTINLASKLDALYGSQRKVEVARKTPTVTGATISVWAIALVSVLTVVVGALWIADRVGLAHVSFP